MALGLQGGESLTPKTDQDPSKAKKILAAGSAAVALVAGGVGLNMALGGGPENSPSIESTEAPSDLASEPSALEEALNPENVPDNPEAEKSEAAPNTIEPVLMTAETPEGLLDQYRHNIMCMINNVDYDAQIKCAEYMYGQSTETGDWSSVLQTLKEHNDYTEIARRADPNYQTNFTYELLDSEATDSSITMTVHETKKLYGEDHTVEKYARLTFSKKVVTLEDLSANGSNQEAWVQVSGEEIQPGSVS